MTMNAHNQRIVDQFTRWAKPFAELPIHAEASAMTRAVNACVPAPDTEILDVACGPGILACALASPMRHVRFSRPAAACRIRAWSIIAGVMSIPLTWRIGDAAALPFEDERFDRVCTRYSFHHMPDPAAALTEMKRVCRAGGRIVVIDATPSPEKQLAYDEMERLRDPSHTSALTLEQLRMIGSDAGLSEALIDGYPLEARLDTLADVRDMPALIAKFDADIGGGVDRIGVGAWRVHDGIRFQFPVSIVAWER